jgi:hypothetical protein
MTPTDRDFCLPHIDAKDAKKHEGKRKIGTRKSTQFLATAMIQRQAPLCGSCYLFLSFAFLWVSRFTGSIERS